MRVELARVALHAAAVIADDPEAGDPIRTMAGATLLAVEAALENGRKCIQVHGGMGFTWEVPAHLYLMRARVLEALCEAVGDLAQTSFGEHVRLPYRLSRASNEDVGDEAVLSLGAVPAGSDSGSSSGPVRSPRLYVEPWELEAGPAEIAQVAGAADRSGFLYVAVCDHTAIPRRLAQAMGTTWYDTVATLGWLAALTTRTRLLSHVYIAALRNPLRSAKEFATLDVLSGGRVIIGVGAGHVPEEFDALGADFEGRGRLLDEAIDGVGDFAERGIPDPRRATLARSRACRVARARAEGRVLRSGSVARPRPHSRRAAERGDGWLPQTVRRSELAEQIPRLIAVARRAAARRADRDRSAASSGPHRSGFSSTLPKRAIVGGSGADRRVDRRARRPRRVPRPGQVLEQLGQRALRPDRGVRLGGRVHCSSGEPGPELMQSRRPFERPIGMGAGFGRGTSSGGTPGPATPGATSGPGRTSIEIWDNKRHGDRFSCRPSRRSDPPSGARSWTRPSGLS